MTTKCILIALLTVALSHPGTPNQDLIEQVRKYGALELVVINEYSPVDLATLVRQASEIGRGLVTDARTFINRDRIWTDYSVHVLSISKGKQDWEGKIVTVRRPGGVVTIEGKTVRSRDPDFPPFETGEEYVLFLNPTSGGHFLIPHGAQGAFKVELGKVAQVSRDTGTWNRERGAVDLIQFLDEVVKAQQSK